jgi:two-component system, chemotaxis family, chemotaxis protein CheY
MEKLNIICIDDQREVLSTVMADLTPLADWLEIEGCESADEATDLMDEIDAEGDFVAVVISDHIMPGQSGVAFLSKVNEDPRFKETKKILLTGQATHQDTIQAVNEADIDRYIEKPWSNEDLIAKVRALTTDFIFEKE